MSEQLELDGAPRVVPDDEPHLRIVAKACAHCGQSFEPRRGSGGTQQKFCCTDCRRKANAKTSVAPSVADIAPASPSMAPASSKDEPEMELLLAQQLLVEYRIDEHGGLELQQWDPNEREYQRIYVNADYLNTFIDRLTDDLVPSWRGSD
jgi:hypothetical protein